MKLLLDEMYPSAIAQQLRRRGHDAVAVKERAELTGQADHIIFAIAQSEGRTLVTENVRHFRPIAAAEGGGRAAHAGVVYTTERAFFRGSRGAIGRLVAALDTLLASDREIDGQEVWLRPV